MNEPKKRPAPKKPIRPSFIVSVLCALVGAVAVVSAIDSLAGRSWATLAAGVILVYAAHLIGDDR